MARRIALLVASLVVALFGASVVFVYVSQANSRAVASLAPVNVLVAKQNIPAGTSAQQASSKGWIKLTKVPRRNVPSGAIDDIAVVRNQVASSQVFAGEILLAAKFVESTRAGTLQIPAGRMAMSVEVQDPQRVGGFVTPGSTVALFDTYELNEGAKTPGTPASKEATALLLPSVQVIAVGPTALHTVGGNDSRRKSTKGGLGGNADDPSAVLTLAVDPLQAVKVAHAAQTGRLYFALLDSTVPGSSGAVDNSTLFAG